MRASIYQQMRQIEEDHWWFTARRQIIGGLIGRYFDKHRSRVLDAGCGTGGNLQMLSEFGQVTGVEMDAAAAAYARERESAEILEGHLPDAFPIDPAECYDLVVALDVLEHIDEDVASMARLKQNLAEQGKLVVTVPAFPSLWSAHDEAHHHKRRYTRDELIAKAAAAGLRVVYASYYNSLLFPPAAAVRLLGRLSSDEKPMKEVAVPNPWLNRILYGVFFIERYLIGRLRLPFGLSLIAVLEAA